MWILPTRHAKTNIHRNENMTKKKEFESAIFYAPSIESYVKTDMPQLYENPESATSFYADSLETLKAGFKELCIKGPTVKRMNSEMQYIN